MTQVPNRTSYFAGETFDPAGLVVKAMYNDGHSEELNDYRLSVTGELSLEDGTVYVLYGMLKTSFSIEIREKCRGREPGRRTIRTASALRQNSKALADRVNAGAPFTGTVFLLTGNLALSEYPDWVPIGRSSAKQFDGIFDGQGYALDNLYSNAGGLFGYVGSNAIIRNVGVASGEIGSDNRSFIGAIAGWSNGADFINCWNGADIRCSGWSGGIVGTVRDGGDSIIRGCYNIGSVTARAGAVGGIVGHLSAGGNGTSVHVTVSACYNMGIVTADDNAGGIAGRVQAGNEIRNCYNAGKVTVTGMNILDGAGDCKPCDIRQRGFRVLLRRRSDSLRRVRRRGYRDRPDGGGDAVGFVPCPAGGQLQAGRLRAGERRLPVADVAEYRGCRQHRPRCGNDRGYRYGYAGQ